MFVKSLVTICTETDQIFGPLHTQVGIGPMMSMKNSAIPANITELATIGGILFASLGSGLPALATAYIVVIIRPSYPRNH